MSLNYSVIETDLRETFEETRISGLSKYGFEPKKDGKLWLNQEEKIVLVPIITKKNLDGAASLLQSGNFNDVIFLFTKPLSQAQNRALTGQGAIVMEMHPSDVVEEPEEETEEDSKFRIKTAKGRLGEITKPTVSASKDNLIKIAIATIAILGAIWFIFLRGGDTSTSESPSNGETPAEVTTPEDTTVSLSSVIGFDLGFINSDSWEFTDAECQLVAPYDTHAISVSVPATVTRGANTILTNNGTVDTCQVYYRVNLEEHTTEPVEISIVLENGEQELILTTEAIETQIRSDTEIKTVSDLIEVSL